MFSQEINGRSHLNQGTASCQGQKKIYSDSLMGLKKYKILLIIYKLELCQVLLLTVCFALRLASESDQISNTN